MLACGLKPLPMYPWLEEVFSERRESAIARIQIFGFPERQAVGVWTDGIITSLAKPVQQSAPVQEKSEKQSADYQ